MSERATIYGKRVKKLANSIHQYISWNIKEMKYLIEDFKINGKVTTVAETALRLILTFEGELE